MRISAAGIDLIKEFEGCRLTSYVCPAGVLTIGYGSTGPHVKEGLSITPKEAADLLAKDLSRFEDAVNDLVKVPMTQSQFDALVSFAFNCGIGAFQESTLLRLLNQEDYVAAAAQFDRWVKGPNGPLPGLVRRRDAEEAMFRKDGVCTNAQAPVVHQPFKIKAKVETLLKKAPIAGAELAENQKSTVAAGKEYNVIWRSKEDGKHVKLSLDYNQGNWYVYADHWDGLRDSAPASSASPKMTGSVVLSTPYFSQRDNIASGNDMPGRTCFSSSSAMLAFTAKPGC
ncbi:MAG: lysozyme, partial [Cyanobium sp.]